uniref:Uncharacterized protein n=1 Tax=Trichuris muris TaxID=70415 RepID=A0A5S6QZR6_TRIMR
MRLQVEISIEFFHWPGIFLSIQQNFAYYPSIRILVYRKSRENVLVTRGDLLWIAIELRPKKLLEPLSRSEIVHGSIMEWRTTDGKPFHRQLHHQLLPNSRRFSERFDNRSDVSSLLTDVLERSRSIVVYLIQNAIHPRLFQTTMKFLPNPFRQ